MWLLFAALQSVYGSARRVEAELALLHDLGLIPINRVSAAQAAVLKAPSRKGGRRVPKSTYVEDKTIETPTGKTVSLYARDGALGLGVLTETGDLHFEPLRRVRTHRNAGRNQTYRWYNDYRLPDTYRRRHDHGPAPRHPRRQRPQAQPDRESPTDPWNVRGDRAVPAPRN